jgi:hypothetical protein
MVLRPAAAEDDHVVDSLGQCDRHEAPDPVSDKGASSNPCSKTQETISL